MYVRLICLFVASSIAITFDQRAKWVAGAVCPSVILCACLRPTPCQWRRGVIFGQKRAIKPKTKTNNTRSVSLAQSVSLCRARALVFLVFQIPLSEKPYRSFRRLDNSQASQVEKTQTTRLETQKKNDTAITPRVFCQAANHLFDL
ncbi:hypothetical protein BDN70DRAFT_881384 [Pholiota conissans]|uniref:Secreted protein n=1 Tax=Pholiota conissans TaxID=109636 RepID=A0A9P5YX41_9AGAR|nr:hypothetical protein BDN70DRAFT_881384 [Pholiota conissans]